MGKKNRVWLNIIGLLVFLLAMPLFFRMGGGFVAMAEVLPGQAVTKGLSFSALFEKEEKVLATSVQQNDKRNFELPLTLQSLFTML